MSYDDFGTRMKYYEGIEAQRRFLPMLPIIARMDGRGFSKFTKGFDKPFDTRMSSCMVRTTQYLVRHTHARIGYTQSDEISLVFYAEKYDSAVFFDARVSKMTSVLAGLTTACFTKYAREYWPDLVEKSLPVFDARVYQVPNKMEATNALLWREQDATKNAVSMAAQSRFSHKALQGISGPQMQEMLYQSHGINFNDYPATFKRGVFVRRGIVETQLDEAALARIPVEHQPENGIYTRSVVAEMDMPRFSTVLNRVEVVFDGAEPQTSVEDAL